MVKQLGESVKRLEGQLAAEYCDTFGSLIQQIRTETGIKIDTTDPKVVLDWVETWSEMRAMPNMSQAMLDERIKVLEKDLKKAKEHVERFDEVTEKINALKLKDLKREGEEIVRDVDSVASKIFGQSALAANEALTKTLHAKIDDIKTQVRNRVEYFHCICVKFPYFHFYFS